MPQARHQDRGGQQENFGPGGGIVRGDDDLLEIEPGEFRQQPATQRPGRVVLAADCQCRLCHMAFPSRIPDAPLRYARCPQFVLPRIPQQATCQFSGRIDSDLASILHGSMGAGWAFQYDADVLSSVSEPNGLDRAMAAGGLICPQIPEWGASGALGTACRAPLRRAGADLTLDPLL